MSLDFTSALYLGLRHPHGSLRPWAGLSCGAPSALDEPAAATQAAAALAKLQGCEAAVLGTSTLHLCWDLFGQLGDAPVALHLDAGVYPIARWGAERAAAKGVPLEVFRHHDADDLRRRLRAAARGKRRPLVVADGFCPACGRPAPLQEYLECVRQYGGRLLLDDTQALGLLGEAPGRDAPYGWGGGGSLRWWNIGGPDLLVVSSLAKGFGVPMATLAGCAETLGYFKARSDTRVHCSPPSLAAVHALERALAINSTQGDARREHLSLLVRRFRQGLGQLGCSAAGGWFPVQTLQPGRGQDAARLHARLLRQGVRCLLHPGRDGRPARLGFLLTAGHGGGDIDAALSVLERAIAAPSAMDRSYAYAQPVLFGGTR